MDTAREMEMTPGGKDERKRVVDLLAHADRAELSAPWENLQPKPEMYPVRGPETGLVMVRGRIGGGGAPFNLGEVTVSRATVRLASGAIGHGQSLGTDREKAKLAAIFDALWQQPETRDFVENRVLAPVCARIEQHKHRNAEEAAATRVDFFTMVRGDD
ncbi:phosphonate C-P lyase system protein PhnG [Rhizobiaceae bacterium n13]|uniref:Phosphonate C-P lyase system protein PhnG n=1 Tax=Ferirhizobium litorale TaxID=2927786 RepID=A0AAE3QFB5_9HYPH|nr:phosphonate C-P lyase system protein PhnG [Fererhizobium litorale]MDI7862900.1 phosphonate C-P lyase system protein PhnG [Fererhizobium litorale]MDI7923986.1 phosphonate C-P lyase system protein PhnG [Fererhizobium litorale]